MDQEPSHSADLANMKALEGPLRRRQDVLIAMFDDPKLDRLRARTPSHPAVLQFDSIEQYLDQGLLYPDESGMVRELATAMLDEDYWIAPSDPDDHWSFIDDRRARDSVRSRIADPDQYHDTMAEVAYWSWLRSRGLDCHLVEDEGLPDIRLDDFPEPVWVEVKRIRLDSTPRRVRQRISKASHQISNATPQNSGVVFISIDRAIVRVALDDKVPSDIEAYAAEARRQLGSGSRHAGVVILTWDDLVIDGVPGSEISYELRRRSLVLEHPNPASTLPITPTTISPSTRVSMTVSLLELGQVSSVGPRLSHGDLIAGPGFRDFNAHVDGVRAEHAITAALNPDAEYQYVLERSTKLSQSIVTRRVITTTHPYTLLIFVHEIAGKRFELGHSYKLYDDGGSLGLSRDPLRAFHVLIHRFGALFGLRMRPDGEIVLTRFIRRATVPTSSPEPLNLLTEVIISPKDEHQHLESGAALIDWDPLPQGGLVTIEWFYQVDVNKYRRAVRRRSADGSP
ncbi:MAG TPA: hypothetical protein VK611_05615 [Acidimicrobiales bacterium]|nr:hypothetical protein [Acidimicrobiales bacterium]